MRLFFALWPDADTRAQISNIAGALRLAGDVRPVPRENYHLTLAFVGEVTMPQLPVLQQIGRGQRGSGCAIKVDACEYWPKSRAVVAVARETPKALIELWTGLYRELEPHRSSLNLKCLHPLLRTHITLARKVAQAPVLQAMSPFYWCARSFSLVSSDTTGAHSVYTVVDTWQLLDETPRP